MLIAFRYKEEFRKMSEEERSSIGVENQKFLRDFDAESPQMEFHHLPQKPSRMEFHLVLIISKIIRSFTPLCKCYLYFWNYIFVPEKEYFEH